VRSKLLAQARGQATGTVRINMPRVAYGLLIAPHLAGFAVRHPEVGLEFALDDGLADIVAARFDAGMRLGESIEADMVAVRIGGAQRMITVAAPDYLARRPAPNTPEDLAAHECVRYRYQSSGRTARWVFQRDGRTLEVEVGGRFIVNDAGVGDRPRLKRGFGLAQIARVAGRPPSWPAAGWCACSNDCAKCRCPPSSSIFRAARRCRHGCASSSTTSRPRTKIAERVGVAGRQRRISSASMPSTSRSARAAASAASRLAKGPACTRCRSPSLDRSMTRPRRKGPRSFTRTTTERPLPRWVTRA
jgi:hypothetical protein